MQRVIIIWTIVGVLVNGVINTVQANNTAELVHLGCWLAEPVGEYECDPADVIPPDELLTLRNLDLRSNELTRLPPEIGQLTALEELDLTLNKLTQLSPTIGQLSRLKFLSLI